jgi:hypothetical protein
MVLWMLRLADETGVLNLYQSAASGADSSLRNECETVKSFRISSGHREVGTTF